MPSPLIIIVAALSLELQGLVDKLTRVSPCLWQGQYSGHKVQVLRTGVGREKVENTLKKANFQDGLIINIGWAGALQPHLRVGSIVTAEKIYQVSTNGPARSLDFSTADIPEKKNHLFCGTLLTINQIADVREKQELKRRYPEALAVDMESFYIAEFCQKRQIPFIVLRSISDTLCFHLSGQNAALDKHVRQAATRSNMQILNFYLNSL